MKTIKIFRKFSIGLFLLAIGMLTTGRALAQAPTCGSNVPFYSINLTGHPDGTWESPSHARLDNCCGTVSPDRCTSFEIILDTGAAGLSFEIASGAIPTGSMFYQVNCGTQVPVGEMICLSGAGPHYLTFCKPGNNPNTYRLRSISKPIFPFDDTTRKGCSLQLKLLGFDAPTVTINSVYPGTSGQYNNYLSCTTNCLTPVFTPDKDAPAYIDYVMSGYPEADTCGYILTVYDTVRIYTLDSLKGSITPNPATYCESGSGVQLKAHATGGDGKYSFKWKNSSNTVVGTDSVYTATAAGTYTLEVSDGLNTSLCPSVYTSVPVTIGSLPVVSAGADQHKCATDPVTYLSGSIEHATSGIWTGGAGTFNPSNTNLFASYTPTATEIKNGSVTLTLTSVGAGGGCTNQSDNVTIYFVDTLKAKLTAPTLLCHTSTVTITSTVTGGSTTKYYLWSTGATTANIVAGHGTYCLTVTDNLGCEVIECITLTSPSALSVSMSSTDVSSNGGNDGTATATPTGGKAPYTYLWNNTQTTQTATGYSYGIATVTVTDANGCTVNGSVVVNEPRCDGFQATTTHTNVTCYNGNDGSATVSLNGGSPPYTFLWSDPSAQTTGTAINLKAGTYIVTVTDSNGCIDITNVVITQPSQITNSFTHTDNLIIGDSSGSATANPMGGTPGYTYLWSTGATTKTITGLKAGVFTVTIKDANNCSITDSVHISQPPCNFNIYANTKDISCKGNDDGKAWVVTAHGKPPFTYAWSTTPVQTIDTAFNLTKGTYTVLVTDSLLCKEFITVTVNEPDQLQIKLSPTQISCNSLNDGTVELAVSGGTYPYYYSWSNSTTAEDLVNLSPGTYSVTVTDANGCSISSSATITQPNELKATFKTTDVTCLAGNDGAIDITPEGGTPPYMYTWSNSSTSQDITGLVKGAYIVTITDANGCSYTSGSIIIDEPDSVIVENVSIGCPDPSTGLANVTVTPSGGRGGPYRVSFNNGSTYLVAGTYSADLAADSTYIILVKDTSGCVSPASKTIHINPVVAITNVKFDSCSAGTKTEVNVLAKGGAGAPYSYSIDSGATFGTAGINKIKLDFNKTYYVVAKDSLGCISLPFKISLPDTIHFSAVISNYNGSAVSCKGSSNGSVSLTISGGTTPYTFSWTGSGGYSSTNEDITGLKAGTYTVVVTDKNGCQVTKSFTLTEPDSLNMATVVSNYNGSAISCKGSSNGSVSLTITGGTTPYTFSWTGSGGYSSTNEDITGLKAGTYTVVVTDKNGCQVTKSFTLTEPDSLNMATVVSNYNGSAVSCKGSTNGSVSLTITGGTTPYTFSWTGSGSYSSTNEDVTGLKAGTYTVVVTDKNGCQVTKSFTLTEPDSLNMATVVSDYNGSAISCKGLSNGSVSLTITGGTTPYTFSWTGSGGYSSTNEDITGLKAGTYTVVVTDKNGCQLTKSFTLTEPDSLNMATVVSDYNGSAISCKGSNNGFIKLTITGGTTPYIYSWTGTGGYSSSNKDVTDVKAGTYTVVVTDKNGCSISKTFILTEPDSLTLSAAVSNYNGSAIACKGEANGSVTLTVTGGTIPYTYKWTGTGGFTSTSKDVTGLKAGTYTVDITDKNGCSVSKTFILTEPDSLDITAVTSDYNGSAIACKGDANGSVTLTVTGGTSPYTYSWTGTGGFTSTSKDISSLKAGSYTVVVTDNNSCTLTRSFSLYEPDALALTANVSDYNGNPVGCKNASNAAISLTVTGGTTPYIYSWTGTGGYTSTNKDVSGLKAGTYSVVVTDKNGCKISNSFTLTEPDSIALIADVSNYNGSAISCKGAYNGSVILSVTGGTTPYTYSWTGTGGYSATSKDATGLKAGTYTVVVTDRNGCTLTRSFTLTEPEQLQANGTTKVATCDGSNGEVNITVTGGTQPYYFNWSNGANTEDLIGVKGGSYTVNITDANGCTFTLTLQVNSTTQISMTAKVTNAACNSSNTGAIDITLTSGQAPYTYRWSTKDTTEDLTGLKAGTYTLVVIDRYGCMAAGTYEVTEPNELHLDITSDTYVGGYNLSHFNSNDGRINLTVQGGTAPYNYKWSNGATTEDLSNLPAGTYMVTVTDAKGCIAMAKITLTQPDILEMPTGYSPNGDGQNDYFVVKGIEAYPNNSLVIFNRWGNEVYSHKNYLNEWNGEDLYNTALPDATYYVVLTINNGEIVLTGYVDLRRK